MDDEGFDLSAIISHNATSSPFPFSPTSSPAPAPTHTPSQSPQVTQLPISKRRGKKRSSRACVTCRRRKVRCDILSYGPPCSNCRLDEIDCVLALSRGQRMAKERAEKALRDSAISNQGERPQPAVETQPSVPAAADTHANRHIPLCPPSSNCGLGLTAISGKSPPDGLQAESKSASPSNAPTPAVFQASNIQHPQPLHCTSAFQPTSLVQVLPEVFASFPPHIDACDLAYLRTRDALSVPSESLQIEILKAYIEFVDSTMPILDLEEFFSVVGYRDSSTDFEKAGRLVGETGRKQVSLLLFQAVMFAGAGYVSLKALREAGFESRECALRTLFDRAELLYDFDTANDRLVIVQSLILMTLHPGYTMKTDKREKDATHFLTIAVSLAFSLGLNRNTTNTFDSRKRRLERRIWWMLFIRDRLLPLDPDFAAGVNVLRIKRVDCGIPILNLSDFEFISGREETMNGEFEETRRRKNARECVDKARLCWCSEDPLICNFSSSYIMHDLPPKPGEYTPTRHASLSGTESPQNTEEEEQILPATSSASFHMSVFESIEENEFTIAYSTASSVPEDCITPQTGKDDAFDATVYLEKDSKCENPLGAGHGVDGEYDDYLEYLSV